MTIELFRSRGWQICRLISTALLLISVLAAAPPGPDAKIDVGLMTTLVDSQDGTAPFFVVFAERTPVAAAHGMRDWAARGRFVVERLQATANRSQNGVRGYLQGRKIDFTPFWVENKIYIPKGTLDLARVLSLRPEVAAIIPEEIYTIPPVEGTGGSVQALGWNILKIGADQVWSSPGGNNGTGIVVANIDTGVQYNHPALVNQYRGNLGGSGFNHAASWSDPTNLCGTTPCDNNGHGTHTMGTMVGDDGGANQIGVAPGAKWIACKGCASSSCSGSALTACAQWILAPGGSSSNRPHVVNNSWGGGSGESWYQSYVHNWVAAGIFPAFSIGNAGSVCNTAGSPGDYLESFASGATDSGDAIASFSSRGPSAFGGIIKPNVSAPGSGINSSVPPNSYDSWGGTSMASPHTAGTVALLWANRPDYKGQISATGSLIANSAVHFTTTQTCGGIAAGASPNNTFGYGRINAKQTVDNGGSAPNLPPTVYITTPATNGHQVDCGTDEPFAATASDSKDGDLTGAILWTGAGTPSDPGGNVTIRFSCSNELGSRTVNATVLDSGGSSGTDSVTVNIVDPAQPAAPSSLAARVSGRNVTLTWMDNSSNESGFKIYRRVKTGKSWSGWTHIIAVTGASYTDTVNTGGNYQYYVKAYSGLVESLASNTVSVRVK